MPHFSGYRLDHKDEDETKAHIFLPGHAPGPNISDKEKPSLEIIRPGDSTAHKVPLQWNAKHDVWESQQALPPDTKYRFIVNGQPKLDLLETVKKNDNAYNWNSDGDDTLWQYDRHNVDIIRKKQDPNYKIENPSFNHIATNSYKAPVRSVVIADIYLDSLVNPKLFQELKDAHGGAVPMRTHHNKFAPNEGLQSLEAAIADLRQGGFTGLLLKPFIGGDNLTSHRYWTTDPYRLNDSFKNKEDYRQALAIMLKNNMKLFADGAFVNQGLNGIQLLSNLSHGHRSPYWGWFRSPFDDGINKLPDLKQAQLKSTDFGNIPTSAFIPSRWEYPKHADPDKGYAFGILPSKKDSKTGFSELNFERFDVAIENDPSKPNHDPVRPTFIKLFDPLREKSESVDAPSRSSDSIHEFRFPVGKTEVLKKLEQVKNLDKNSKKLAMSQWQGFRLTTPRADDSGQKWDGKIDVALMNTENPEVQNYLKGAVAYWSRLSINTLTSTVASELNKHLSPEAHDPNSIQTAFSNITVRPNIQADWQDSSRLLPPVERKHQDTLSKAEITRIIQETQEQQHLALGETAWKQAGSKLAQTMLQEVPLSILPLPDLFKAILSAPSLSRHLGVTPSELFDSKEHQKGFFKSLTHGHSFQEQLGEKLQLSTQYLPVKEREKLLHPQIRSLVSDKLSEALYLHLLTDLDINKLVTHKFSPQEIENAFYKTVPPRISNTDPQFGARQLARYLQKKLQDHDVLRPEVLGTLLESTLKPLNPLSVALSEQLLQKREFGLNWRIDAAKDVADTALIRKTEFPARALLFKLEMYNMGGFWRNMAQAMRQSFPKSTLIAELTNIDELSGGRKLQARQEAQKITLNYLFKFLNAMPNMNSLYSQLPQLIHHDPRPDENGGSQISPSQFLNDVLHPSAQSMPFSTMLQMQNLVCSHDHNSATQTFLSNPALKTLDLQKHWGLKDDLKNTFSELRDKTCFADRLTSLAKHPGAEEMFRTDGFSAFFDKFSDFLELNNTSESFNLNEDLLERFQKKYNHLKPFISKQSKSNTFGDQRFITPLKAKSEFVDAIFEALESHEREDLGLPSNPKTATPDQRDFEAKLRNIIKQRILEPSEAKSMRASIVNSMLTLKGHNPQMSFIEADEVNESSSFWTEAAEKLNLPEDNMPKLQKATEQALWNAIDKTIQTWKEDFGHQAPHDALNNVFKHFDSKDMTSHLPELSAQKIEAFKNDLKSSLYSEMMAPILPKLLRTFAVQNALPGNPSVYLPDWVAQGGGEREQNVFIQNRGLINPRGLKGEPQGLATPEFKAQFKDFQKQASAIFNTRVRGLEVPGKADKTLGPGALNEGSLLDIPADDEKGILPIIRDNGREQVMTLVYTGLPSQPKDWHNKVGAGTIGYENIGETEGALTDYRTQFKHPELTPGRIYRDAINGERFRLNDDGELRSLKNPDKGIDIETFRILIRELKSHVKV
jgi:hypothetical protein